MGAGAGGFLLGGPVGAAAAGIGAGAAVDSAYTIATDKPHGYIAAVESVVENPSAGVFSLKACSSRIVCALFRRIFRHGFDAGG